MAHPDRIHLLEREGKLGLGTAYIAGFRWALERGYDFIFEMDCDFSHDPHDLVRLRIPCAEGGAGMSVGSRYVKGGGVANWPVNRLILSYGASIYVNTILGLGVRDSTAGFVCYRRETLETIQLDAVQFVGYAFQIEMKLRAKRNGFVQDEHEHFPKPCWACSRCGSSASFSHHLRRPRVGDVQDEHEHFPRSPAGRAPDAVQAHLFSCQILSKPPLLP